MLQCLHHYIQLIELLYKLWNNARCTLFCVGPLTSVLLSLPVRCCVPRMKWQVLLLSSATYIIMNMIPKGTYLYTYVFALYAEYVLLLTLILSRLCMYTKKYIQGTYWSITLYRTTIDFYHSIRSHIIPSKCKLKVSYLLSMYFTCTNVW